MICHVHYTIEEYLAAKEPTKARNLHSWPVTAAACDTSSGILTLSVLASSFGRQP